MVHRSLLSRVLSRKFVWLAIAQLIDIAVLLTSLDARPFPFRFIDFCFSQCKSILMVSAWLMISNLDSEVYSHTFKRCASVLHDASTQ